MEMERTPIVISLAPEVRELVDENGIDLVAALRDQGLDVTRSDMHLESSSAQSGLKSIELIILAAGAAAPLVASAIARVIDAINRGRKTVVTTSEGEAALVASGASRHSLKVTFLGLSISTDDRFERKHR